MRITFSTEGGFASLPGLRRPATIDTDQLPPGEAGELHRLLDAANFFELSEQAAAPPPGAADYRQYTISVEDGTRSHTVRVADTVGSPQVQALVANLQAKTRARLDSTGA